MALAKGNPGRHFCVGFRMFVFAQDEVTMHSSLKSHREISLSRLAAYPLLERVFSVWTSKDEWATYTKGDTSGL